MEGCSSSDTPNDALVATLVSRGWCFRNPNEIRALVESAKGSASTAAAAGASGRLQSKGRGLLELIESELLNMDLRSFGGKSLPDASSLRKLSHLQGPKVLQVVSSRDIYQSSIDASFRNSQSSRRLLQIVLTDGNIEATAIEYIPIPAITEDVIPGLKVCLENRIAIHNGILCLNPKAVNILGGVVNPLYEEWQLDQKYSGVSCLSARPSHTSDGAGPPPYEKLQLDKWSPLASQQHRSQGGHLDVKLDSRGHGHQFAEKRGETNSSTSGAVDEKSEMHLGAKKPEENVSGSEARPKEAVETMPVQNQAAAQKLLQKLNQSNEEGRPFRGQRQRGKGKIEEAVTFTLEEWERRKANASKSASIGESLDLCCDEEFAWQLQRQLDMEDYQVPEGHNTEAEKIRMSMFSFQREEERNDGRGESRGRGRRRGRGRGRRFG